MININQIKVSEWTSGRKGCGMKEGSELVGDSFGANKCWSLETLIQVLLISCS